MARRFRWVAHLALLVVSGLVSLALAEIAVRLWGRFPPVPRTYVSEYRNRNESAGHLVADPVTGWRLRPRNEFSWDSPEFRSAYRTNSQGFRARADFDPAESRNKIVLAGDSFVFGTGVNYEDTIGAVLESSWGGRAVVYNLAMPGFGIDQMWLSVRHQALPLKPSLVVVAFIREDLARSQEAYRSVERLTKPVFRLDDGRLVPLTAADRPGAMARFLDRHSHLWSFGRLCLRRAGNYVPLGEWWRLNWALLDQIRADCGARGVPVLFVQIPTQRRQRSRCFARRWIEPGRITSTSARAPCCPRALTTPRTGI